MEEESESLFSSLINKIFRKEDDDLEKSIEEASREGHVPQETAPMLLNILHMGSKQVREIMIPRTDIVCAESDASLQDVWDIIVEFGHSRIPIYHSNRDNIVGVVHAKDILKVLPRDGGEMPDIAEVMRKPLFIPDTKNVADMLQVFRTNMAHMAVALDEYGGTSGVVTFEDVLEEIVGEIEDEYDIPQPDDIQHLDNGSYLVSGRATLGDLDERLGLSLDSELVETLSGYLCELAGKVPIQGTAFNIEHHSFEIKEADAKQIHWVIIHDVPEQVANDDG